jgi:hypothetical protein
MAHGSSHSITSRLPEPLLHCGYHTIQACQPCCPTGALNFLLSASSMLPQVEVNPRLHALLFCWCQEVFLPQSIEAQD